MTDVDLTAVLSPYVVARVFGIPEDFDLDYHWATTDWDNELLVVEGVEVERHESLMKQLREEPWVKSVTLWVGGEPSDVHVIGEITHRSGEYLDGIEGEHGEVALIADSESVVKEMEEEASV